MSTERLRTALADRYRVERELGQGGMATVYLAHDLRHDRDVAIKVLHPDLGAALGGERFLSEIRTTARLQHPHILPLLDSGEADGLLYYVMPLVTGETLRARLERERQLPIDAAVLIAREVADALGYAHGLGVIHRDIKPENILLQGGHALVADFGIALAVQQAGGQRMTQTGLSLGTPQYMSPEQAMGEKQVDARSDIYALGAVTYEMLVGEAPFTGPSVQAIVARLITESPRGLAAQRKAVPEHLEDAVLRALEKLPADRFATAAEFAAALADPFHAPTAVRARKQVPLARRGWPIGALTGWTVAAAAIAFAAWSSNRTPNTVSSQFAIGFPQGQALDITSDGTHIAVSRDGSTLVYVGGDSSDSRLYLKRRDQLAAVAVPGTEGAYNPFFSPDGLEIAFLSERGRRALYRIALAGGLPSVVYRGPLGTSGGSWGTDGYIYIDTDAGGLQRFHPDGSGRETVMALDAGNAETGFAWPEVLPGDRVVIARVRRSGDSPDEFDIVAGRIGTTERTTVTRAVSARYVQGRLLFVTADGTLQSALFDTDKLALTGPPAVIATGVRVAGTYAGVDLAVDRDGGLHYVAGPAGLTSQLEWVDRGGTVMPIDSAWQMTGFVWDFALSPDGSRIAVSLTGGGTIGMNIWVKQLAGGFMKVAGPGASSPSWSSDGKWIYYSSGAGLLDAVHRVRADGLGGDSVVMRGERHLGGPEVSRDGRWMVATAHDTMRPSGIVVAELGRDTVARPLIASSASDLTPALSPDGRWLAYVSTTSGRAEVYVRPFPAVDGGLTQVSINGGYGPKWANSGNALYFRELGAGALMVADVLPGPEFQRRAPRVAFRATAGSGTMMGERFDISTDDSRLIVLSRGSAQRSAQLVRIDNVFSALRNLRSP